MHVVGKRLADHAQVDDCSRSMTVEDSRSDNDLCRWLMDPPNPPCPSGQLPRQPSSRLGTVARASHDAAVPRTARSDYQLQSEQCAVNVAGCSHSYAISWSSTAT